MGIKVYFAGLCAFSKMDMPVGNKTYQGFRVMMVPGHNDHRPVLTAAFPDKTKGIDLTKTTWQPDLISYATRPGATKSPFVVQVATWYLDALTVQFDGTPTADVGNSASTFQFVDYHSTATTLAPEEVIAKYPTTSIFEITQGKLTSVDANQFKVVDANGSDKQPTPVNLAPEVILETDFLVLRRDRYRVIHFKDGADAIVSNLAAVASTNNSHFHHYYDSIDLKGGTKVKIVNSVDPFYDCVPPGSTPP